MKQFLSNHDFCLYFECLFQSCCLLDAFRRIWSSVCDCLTTHHQIKLFKKIVDFLRTSRGVVNPFKFFLVPGNYIDNNISLYKRGIFKYVHLRREFTYHAIAAESVAS